MISLTSVSLKSTTDVYLREQAELLARSGVEYALLAISGHDNSNSCIENINITYPNSATPTHEVNMTIQYFYHATSPHPTPANCSNILDPNIATQESDLTVLIDAIVTVDMNNTGITEPIVIHKRTIQKP
jgi:hypothetical protein